MARAPRTLSPAAVQPAQAAPAPVAVEAAPAPEPAPVREETALVRPRFGFALYLPTQQKRLEPGETTRVIVDSWIANQLNLENGALVRVNEEMQL